MGNGGDKREGAVYVCMEGKHLCEFNLYKEMQQTPCKITTSSLFCFVGWRKKNGGRLKNNANASTHMQKPYSSPS